MSLINTFKHAPTSLSRLVKIEWGQLLSRGLKRYLLLRYKSLRARFSKQYPESTLIEPFGGCNIRCQMCFQGRVDLPGGKEYMDMDTYKRIIDEVSQFTSRLYLFWRGEPLMHPDLVEMIRYARRRNMYVFISTNAVLLTRELAKELIEAGLDFLLVGFDGASKESYERMRRGAKFERVLANIKDLVELKKSLKSYLPYVCLQMIVSSINQHELKAFRQLSKQVGADSFIEKKLNVFENYDSEKINQALRPLVVKGIGADSIDQTTEQTLNIIPDNPTCIWAKRIVIRADGELSLCCMDAQGKYEIGSANHGRILDIWFSPEYQELRRKGYKRSLPICKNCGV